MKCALYWYFIHPRYDKLIRAILEIHHLDPVCIESYLDSRNTSKTYTYGLIIKDANPNYLHFYTEPLEGVKQ